MSTPITSFVSACRAIVGKDKNKRLADVIADKYNADIHTVLMAVFGDTPFNINDLSPQIPIAHSTVDNAFIELIVNILIGQYSGDIERTKAVNETLALYSVDDQLIFIDLLRRLPRIGFTEKFLSKIVAPMGYFTPKKWSIQLAKKLDSEAEYAALFNGPLYLVERKYDGDRNIAMVKPDGTVTMRSRSGKDVLTVSEQITSECSKLAAVIAKQNPDLFSSGVVLDGEIVAGSFTDTRSAKAADADKSQMKYVVFGVIPLDSWNSGVIPDSLQNRKMRTIFEYAFDHTYCEKIHMAAGLYVTLFDSAKRFYDLILDDGGEGVVIKPANGVYEFKRSTNWIKMVPTTTFDGHVINYQFGDKGSKYESQVASVTICGTDEHGDMFMTNVGSGFDDGMRAWMTSNVSTLKGRAMTISSRGVSVDSKTGVNSIRFPVFESWRESKV